MLHTHKKIIRVTSAGQIVFFLACYNFQSKLINGTSRESSCGYSQRDQSLHCDHEVRGVQWVLANRSLRPSQQGQQVRVVPIFTDGRKLLMFSTKGTACEEMYLICLWIQSGCGVLLQPSISLSTHSLSGGSSRSSSTLVSSLTLNRYDYIHTSGFLLRPFKTFLIPHRMKFNSRFTVIPYDSMEHGPVGKMYDLGLLIIII